MGPARKGLRVGCAIRFGCLVCRFHACLASKNRVHTVCPTSADCDSVVAHWACWGLLLRGVCLLADRGRRPPGAFWYEGTRGYVRLPAIVPSGCRQRLGVSLCHVRACGKKARYEKRDAHCHSQAKRQAACAALRKGVLSNEPADEEAQRKRRHTSCAVRGGTDVCLVSACISAGKQGYGDKQ